MSSRKQPVPGPKDSAGAHTRRAILRKAVDIASAEGLEGLTIGRLARDLSMSKSGLFGHFGSKIELQLATVETAREIFIEAIIDPASKIEKGRARLTGMVELWISYVEGSVFRGGCFFAAASAEFDGRPGPVRDQIAALTKTWVEMLEAEAIEALSRGEIRSDLDPRQLVFELHAFVQEANWAHQLLNDPQAFTLARTAIANRLQTASL